MIFVEDAAPNEVLWVQIDRERRGTLEGHADELVEASADRVTPRCSLFGRCGGCSLQHVSYGAQLRAKEAALESALVRIGRLDLSKVEVAPSFASEPYGRRTRARLHVAPARGRPVIGFYARRSNDIVDVTACPIVSPKLEAALEGVRSELRRVHRAAELELVESREGVLIGAPTELLRANSISATLDGAARFVDPAFGALAPEDGQGDHFVSPESFTQSHGAGNSALVGDVSAIVDELRPETILELYAGSGNITRALVAEGRSVLAVERDPRSADLFARAFAGVPRDPRSVEDAVLELQKGPKRFDLIVADPPREGLPEPVRRGIVALRPRAMVLVSCDLAAFARDVGWFAKRGFALDRVRLYDFYPQTDHAEVLGRLRAQP